LTLFKETKFISLLFLPMLLMDFHQTGNLLINFDQVTFFSLTY